MYLATMLSSVRRRLSNANQHLRLMHRSHTWFYRFETDPKTARMLNTSTLPRHLHKSQKQSTRTKQWHVCSLLWLGRSADPVI